MAVVPISHASAGRRREPMPEPHHAQQVLEGEHFGVCLRRARERRGLTLADLAIETKVPRSSLELLEAGDLAALPAEVFVRGFIRSYARVVGVNEIEPLQLYD